MALRRKLSDVLSGGLQGAGAAAPMSGGNPWIIAGGAGLGVVSSLLGEEETKSEKLSRLLMQENLTQAQMQNRANATEMRKQRELERRQKTVGTSLGGFMRGAMLARQMTGGTR